MHLNGFFFGCWLFSNLMNKLPAANPFGNATIYYLPETYSTMTDAAALAAQGAPSGTVVVAGYQTAGRGRFADRKWISRPGDGLLFTLILDAETLEVPFALTPLLSGLGIALFVEAQTGRRASIKWPNDVLVDGGKISGILCESKERRVFIGIGLNCMKSAGPPSASDYHPISLADLDAPERQPLSILPAVLGSVKHAFAMPDPLGAIEERLYLRGQPVTHLSGAPGGDETIIGTVDGLGPKGQLLLREKESGEIRELFSGEVMPQRSGL